MVKYFFWKGDVVKKLEELDLSKKKYIIFDMDGTLIDSIGIWNESDFRIIDKFAGVQVDFDKIQQERDWFLETHSSEDIYVAYCDYLIQKYHMNISKDELILERWDSVDSILKSELTYKHGVPELLRELKEQGFTLVLATATTQRQIDIYANQNLTMAHTVSLYDTFDFILRKEDVVHKKPHPEIYLKVLEHYQTNPDLCLVFEDSLHGVMASKGAEIETINVYDKYSDKDRLQINSLTDYKIQSYSEFINVMLGGKSYEYKKRNNKGL